MKARVKATGEIINIADYSTITLDKCDSYGVPIDYTLDEVEIINEPTQQKLESDSDMPSEQRMRYELAKAAMQGGLSSSNETMVEMDIAKVTSMAIRFADKMIKELKKTSNKDEFG